MSTTPRATGCTRLDLHRMLARYEFAALSTQERHAIETHVLDCDVCFAEIERGVDAVAALRRQAEQAAEPRARAALTARARRSRSRYAWLWAPAAVAAAVAGIAVVQVLRAPTAAELATFPTETLAPEILRAPGAPDAVTELVATGAAHFDLGHYAQAAERFHAALARDPARAEIAYLAGLATALAGDARAAIPDLETAVGLASGELRARASWVLANAYLRAGIRGAAVRVLVDLRAQGGPYAEHATALLQRLGVSPSDARRQGAAELRSEVRLGSVLPRRGRTDALDEARQSFDAERWADALEDAQRVAAEAAAREDATLEIDARQLAGDCLFEQGLAQKAAAEFAQAAAAAARTGDRTREIRALEGSARVCALRGELRQALASFQTVVDAARSAGDPMLECRALIGLGQSATQAGERANAVQILEQALALARDRRSLVLESGALQSLALAVHLGGDPEQAAAIVEQAVECARRTGKKREIAAALTRAGFLYVESEQYSRSLAALREALPLAQALGQRRVLLNIHGRQATIYADLGFHSEALRELETARALAAEMRVVRAEGGLLRRTGQVLAALGRDEDASHAFDRALAITRKMGVATDEIDMLHVVGEFQLERGQLAAARRSLRDALTRLDSLPNPQMAGHLESLLGEIAAREGDPERARLLCAGAIARARMIGDRAGLRDGLRLEATLLRDEGDLHGADRRLAEAIEVSESVRAGLAGGEHRLGFHDVSRPLYLERVSVLYDIGGSARDEAFRVMEMARARVLLDALAGVRVEPDASVDPGLRARHAQCLRRLRVLQIALSRAKSEAAGTNTDTLSHAYDDASRALRDVRDEISASAPSYASLVGIAGPLGVREVQERVLAPGQVLIEYLVGHDASHVAVLDARGLRMQRLAIGSVELETLVSAHREAIVRDDSDAFATTSRRLHDVLVAPAVAGLAPDARLLIVPDGPLFELSFAALHDGQHFLVAHHAIAQAPSASALDSRLRSAVHAPPTRLLAIGNPTSYRESALLESVRALHGWSFGELPYSEVEVERVARHFRRKKVLVRKGATEEAVKRHIGGAGVVHFATHGVIDASEPLLCGLVLAQDDDPREDGLLQVHEILGLRLDADLVVLSACGSGLGRRVGGEGVLGLTRAFLHSGARQLVFSLWDVADRSSVDLMGDFYAAHFEDGLAADAALRAAQVRAIARGSRPRHWAAFALAGAVEAAPPAAVSRR